MIHAGDSEKPVLRYYESWNTDPALAMATDEYFLHQAQAGQCPALLRLYTMRPSAITVGYFFKKKHLMLEKIKKDRVQVVRRITGGNAVFHVHDLTYSFICRKGLFGIEDNKSLYLFLAPILQKSLEKAGIPSVINTATTGGINSPHCFNSVSQYEIKGWGGEKIIGSAQKILSDSCIQQGAIFYNFNSSALLPYLSGSFDRAPEEKEGGDGDSVSCELLLSRIKEQVQDYFVLEEFSPSAGDKKAIGELVKNKYAEDTWNYAR